MATGRRIFWLPSRVVRAVSSFSITKAPENLSRRSSPTGYLPSTRAPSIGTATAASIFSPSLAAPFRGGGTRVAEGKLNGRVLDAMVGRVGQLHARQHPHDMPW